MRRGWSVFLLKIKAVWLLPATKYDNGLNEGDALRRWRRDYEYDSSSSFSSPAIVAVGTECVSYESKFVADEAMKQAKEKD
jgi:hypothetical protein